MGFKNHKYLWILSPFKYPYDRISHLVLGFIAGYYYNKLLIILFLYQIMNAIYGDNRSRLPSIMEYIIGFLIAIVIKEQIFEKTNSKKPVRA